MKQKYPDWLKDLSTDKLLKRIYHCAFNVGIMYHDYMTNKKNIYREEDKYVMYESELRKRLKSL